MKRLLVAAVALFALLAFAALVAFFVFAYIAALRPGGPDPEFDAAWISMIATFVCGMLAAGAAYVLDVRGEL